MSTIRQGAGEAARAPTSVVPPTGPCRSVLGARVTAGDQASREQGHVLPTVIPEGPQVDGSRHAGCQAPS